MKKVILALCILLLNVFAFAQVRDSVCVVKEVFYEKNIEDMNNFAQMFRKNGNKTIAEAFEKYAQDGGFGSGFIFVDTDGKNYVVTNRHVVEQAETLNIEFIKSDGTVTKYDGLTIVAIGQDLDIALLAFPEDNQPFTKGLELYEKPLDDGTTVYSAGYPGLLGEPSWQLGTGHITNGSARVPKLVDPEITTLLQHSAMVDSGNSGGPLLVKNQNKEYKVVGINTWKVLNRQSTNFSIPAKAVGEFIEKSLRGEPEDPVLAIKEQASKLEKVLANKNAKFEDLVPFISIQYVADFGRPIFEDVLKRCSKENLDYIMNVFFNESPIEGMRNAIAWYIFMEYHKSDRTTTTGSYGTEKKEEDKEPELLGFSDPEKIEDTDRYIVEYNLQRKKTTANAEWINEHGIWRLYSLNNSKTRKKLSREVAVKDYGIDESKITSVGSLNFYVPYKIALYETSALRAFPATDSLCFDFAFNNFMAVNAQCGVTPINGHGILNANQKMNPVESISALAGIKFQAPLMVKNSFYFIPYVDVLGGAKIGLAKDVNFGAQVQVNGALRALTVFAKHFDVYADVGYSFTLDIAPEKSMDHGFFLGLGLAF